MVDLRERPADARPGQHRPRGASRPPCRLSPDVRPVYHPCTRDSRPGRTTARRRDGPESAPPPRGAQGTLTRRAANGTGHVTLASRDRSAHVPGREPGAGWRPRGPGPLQGSPRLRPDAEARRDADGRRRDRPDRSRPPQQLELLVGPGVRPHLREPHVVRREDQHRAVPRHQLGGHERRQDLHVQAPPEREVPQRPDHERRRRQVQHRAGPRPEDGVAVDLLAEVDQGDQGRRSLDRADEPRRPLSAPRLVRRDPGVGDHPERARGAGEPQDQGNRHRAVQARRVRAPGPDRLRAEPRLLGQVAPVSRRDGLQGPDRGECPDRRSEGRPDPVRVPLRPGCGPARGRARDHRRQEPHRLGRRPLHQPAEQAARATRASGAPCGWPSTRTR